MGGRGDSGRRRTETATAVQLNEKKERRKVGMGSEKRQHGRGGVAKVFKTCRLITGQQVSNDFALA